jgi:GNAT superfamily N-acetyltransferase
MEGLVSGPLLGQSAVCECVLRALPEWFGIEAAVQEYVRSVDDLRTFIVQVQGETAGFLTLKQHTPYAAELYVMGILPRWHRHGFGTALLAAAEAYLRGLAVQYLQVKTLSDKHPDPGYALTRAFYFRSGFRPLQEIEQIWGPDNPCLLMVKRL